MSQNAKIAFNFLLDFSHYNNKHLRQSAYFKTKNPFDVFTDERSYDSESEDEINCRREGSSKSTRSRPKYNRTKPSQKQRKIWYQPKRFLKKER